MLNGFWTVTFHTDVDAGAGVVAVRDGQATGGDTSFSYVGPLSVDPNGQITGELSIMRHSNLQPGLIPGLDNYLLTVSGSTNGNQFDLACSIKGQPGPKVTVKGKRISLPAQ